MSERTISIPLTEYENYRNSVMYHDKQPIYKELQKVLQEKSQDLERYKEKYEQCSIVLKRTQKQLDYFMQNAPGKQSPATLVPTPIATKCSSEGYTTGGVKLVSRSIGEDESGHRAVEHDETSDFNSLRAHSGLKSIVPEGSNITRSLPVNFSGISTPGMSAALLKKLVQENLKLRKQLEGKQSSKITKIPEEPEDIIGEIKRKAKSSKEMDSLDILKTSKSDPSSTDLSNETSTRDPANESEKIKKNLKLYRLHNECLTKEIENLKRDKKETEDSLEGHRQLHKINTELEQKRLLEIEGLTQENKRLTLELDDLRKELHNANQKLEAVEVEHSRVQQNYKTLINQFQSMSVQSPPIRSTEPTRPGRSSGFFSSTSTYPNMSASTPSSLHTSESLSQIISQPDEQPPLPPRTMRFPPQASVVPQAAPRERKTYKCPKCERVFDILQTYRDHIKVCLKAS